MYRGTTPIIQLSIQGLSEIEIEKFYLTLVQPNITIEKTLKDLEIDGNLVQCKLSQQETLSLYKSKVKIQCRILSKSDIAYATQIITLDVDEILKDGEI